MSVERCGVFVLLGISCTRILKNKLKAEHCCCSCLSFSIDQCLKSGSDRCGVFFFFLLQEITSSALADAVVIGVVFLCWSCCGCFC